MSIPRPVILAIMDGWGISPIAQGNAIALAKKPIWDTIQNHYPSISLQASGIAVGLPWGEMGNSETGHLNIGAGFVVYQDLPRISLAIQNGSFFKIPAFTDAMEKIRNSNKKLHVVGIFSAGGVHGHIDHIYALLELAKQQGIKEVYIHAITDGRDTAKNVAAKAITDFMQRSADLGLGKIATIGGRFYGMDRNENWYRTKQFYDAMICGEGPRGGSATEIVQKSYTENIFDELIVPTIITENGNDLPRVEDGDLVIFSNYRPDRARQLTKAIAVPDFAKFDRKKTVRVETITMTEYEDGLPVTVAFGEQVIKHPLAEVISTYGLKQTHIAETEKYAHVTYFFDGGVETPFPNEQFFLIPSASVASYDEKPEMSAKEITDKLISLLEENSQDFIVVNYANADMVGHTGNLQATIKSVEAFDQQLGRLLFEVLKRNAVLLITADHGNAEIMIDPQTGEPDKEHSSNPVPFVVVHKSLQTASNEADAINRITRQLNPSGGLTDIAPTILDILKIEKPKDMTGRSLLPVMGIKRFD